MASVPFSQALFSPCLCSAPREEDDEPSESLSTTQTPSTAVPEPHIKPRLGELAVTDTTPDSLSLSWTVPEGQFDHFLIQYKNGYLNGLVVFPTFFNLSLNLAIRSSWSEP